MTKGCPTFRIRHSHGAFRVPHVAALWANPRQKEQSQRKSYNLFLFPPQDFFSHEPRNLRSSR